MRYLNGLPLVLTLLLGACSQPNHLSDPVDGSPLAKVDEALTWGIFGATRR